MTRAKQQPCSGRSSDAVRSHSAFLRIAAVAGLINGNSRHHRASRRHHSVRRETEDHFTCCVDLGAMHVFSIHEPSEPCGDIAGRFSAIAANGMRSNSSKDRRAADRVSTSTRSSPRYFSSTSTSRTIPRSSASNCALSESSERRVLRSGLYGVRHDSRSVPPLHSMHSERNNAGPSSTGNLVHIPWSTSAAQVTRFVEGRFSPPPPLGSPSYE